MTVTPLFIAPGTTPVVPSNPKLSVVKGRGDLSPCSGDIGKDISMGTGLAPTSHLHKVVAAQLEGASFLRPFVVQTCGHTPIVTLSGVRREACPARGDLCREITALIVSGTLRSPVSEADREGIDPLAARAGVPLFSVQYDPTDHTSPAVVTHDGKAVASDLRGLGLAASVAQARHFSSAHPECYQERGRSNPSRVSEWSDPLERALRKVPTSRVVSVDGALVCDGCREPIGIVDVRPIYESHRRSRVSYLMSLAKPLGVPVVLVEHYNHYSESRPARALTYRGAGMEPESTVKGSIHDIAGALYDVIDEHQCNVGGH